MTVRNFVLVVSDKETVEVWHTETVVVWNKEMLEAGGMVIGEV